MLRSAASLRPQGNRHGNRLRLGVPAGLVLTHKTRRCLIDNISASGARIRIEEPLARGRTAMLCFHELRLYGTVMWSRSGECGVRFEQAAAAGGHGRLPVDRAAPQGLSPPLPGKRGA